MRKTLTLGAATLFLLVLLTFTFHDSREPHNREGLFDAARLTFDFLLLLWG